MKIKCLECGRRIKAKKRCAECQRQRKLQRQREYYQRNKEKWGEYNNKAKEYRRQYYRRHKQRYRLYYQEKRPCDHRHDRTTDLTIENGRVKGTVWLENQQKRYKIAWKGNTRYYGKGKGLCSCIEKPFFIAEKNNRTYCFECGGKFVIAFENDYYTITEVCCCFCGVVLPQTTP
ncbi:MAG: hypothetical protein OEX10_03890 [Candidatus Bathyarchaeota archaeon]|nr:hypothetical protein [Candidatus Bathyarchaeota archaeon]